MFCSGGIFIRALLSHPREAGAIPAGPSSFYTHQVMLRGSLLVCWDRIFARGALEEPCGTCPGVEPRQQELQLIFGNQAWNSSSSGTARGGGNCCLWGLVRVLPGSPPCSSWSQLLVIFHPLGALGCSISSVSARGVASK